MRKLFSALIMVMGLLMIMVGVSGATDSEGDGDHKVTICHATSSETNPYTVNDIPKQQIARDKGHGSPVHTDDIIPPFPAGDHGPGWEAFPGQNWDARGQAIYNNGCTVPTTSTTTPSTTTSSTTAPSTTVPPTTTPSTTVPPTTTPPTTEPPVTVPPTTEPPVVVSPTITAPPVTEPPVTTPPVTEPPVTTPPDVGPPPTTVVNTVVPPLAVPKTVPVPNTVATTQPVIRTQLAETGSSDSLPVLTLAGIGLLVMGVMLSRKSQRI